MPEEKRCGTCFSFGFKKGTLIRECRTKPPQQDLSEIDMKQFERYGTNCQGWVNRNREDA